jgi:hypothetical protein
MLGIQSDIVIRLRDIVFHVAALFPMKLKSSSDTRVICAMLIAFQYDLTVFM